MLVGDIRTCLHNLYTAVQDWHQIYILIKYVVFIQGLITEECENIDPEALPFARKIKEVGLREGASLVEVVFKMLAE